MNCVQAAFNEANNKCYEGQAFMLRMEMANGTTITGAVCTPEGDSIRVEEEGEHQDVFVNINNVCTATIIWSE